MTHRIRTFAALTVGTIGTLAFAGQAHAASCGGQHAAPHPVPYTCTNSNTIDGTLFSAVTTANGTTVTVTITLDAPRQVDTPARIVHHEGISGAGGTSDQAKGVIPAGATTITLTDSAPCRAGQLDIKVWHTGNGQSEGRVGGPWIENGNSCTTPPVTAPPTTVPPATTPQTPTPPSVTPTVPGPASPSAPSTSSPGQASSSQALPATGTNLSGALIGAGFIAAGAFVLLVARRKAV